MITPVGLNFADKINNFKSVSKAAVTEAIKGFQVSPSFRGSVDTTPKDDVFEKRNEEFHTVGEKRGTILNSPGEDFIKWAEETDFINTGLKEVLMPENFIGEGFKHAAYKIPSNDNYVLRVPRDFRIRTSDIDFSDYKIENTWDSELTRNCGQQVALLDVKNRAVDDRRPQIEVLLKQNGYPNSNPSPMALKLNEYSDELRPGVLSYEDDLRKKHFARCMKALAEMPDETYDLLIEDLIVAGEAGYKFDHNNSNNFLIDEENQKINIIDMESTVKPHKDRFGNTLSALVNAEFFTTYFNSCSSYSKDHNEEQYETFENIVTVLDKYTRALQRNHQKFNASSYSSYVSLLTSGPASFWLQTWDINEKLQKLSDMGVLYDPEHPGKHPGVSIR